MQKIVLTINGICCDNCAQHIKDSLEELAEVEHVDVYRDKNCAEVFLKEGQCPSDDAMKQAVDDVGYEVAAISK